MEHPFILGSAGHIDHGKTTLVRALTGVDCDRMAEEKRRGITIELGFAPLTLNNGKTVSIVDVPGHERFIRQMVAGAAGIDAVMLLVAADEGVMPQTREHLDILKLLGVKNGVVVLNKTDLVDSDTLEVGKLEVRQLLQGSFLEDAPLIPVSALTGDGTGALLEAIEAMVDATPPRSWRGAFFMPIDRAFSVRGFGSVVTGTVYRGTLSTEDEVEVMPSGLRTKIRSMQVHGASSSAVLAGQRAAINLASVSLEQLHRGDVICEKGRFAPTECVDVWLDVLESAPESVVHWQRLRLHIGTTDVVARVSLPAGRDGGAVGTIEPGRGGLAQLLPESPIVVASGERFVVRFYSPLETIGGGRVLIPCGERPQSREEREKRIAFLEPLVADESAESFLAALVRQRGLVSERDLFGLSQMEREEFDRAVSTIRAGEEGTGILSFGSPQRILLSRESYAAICSAVASRLSEYHASHEELSGLDIDDLYSLLRGIPGLLLPEARDFRELMRILTERGHVAQVTVGEKTRYAAPGFVPKCDERFEALLGRLRAVALSAGYELAEASQLPEKLSVSRAEVTRAIGYLRENEDLRLIGEGLLFPKETRDGLLEHISSMADDITVARVRDKLGTSRRYVVAMLEFFDSEGVTRRVGEKRVLFKNTKI